MAKMLRSIGAAIAEDGTFVRSEGKTVREISGGSQLSGRCAQEVNRTTTL
jgi:hypothetical protein